MREKKKILKKKTTAKPKKSSKKISKPRTSLLKKVLGKKKILKKSAPAKKRTPIKKTGARRIKKVAGKKKVVKKKTTSKKTSAKRKTVKKIKHSFLEDKQLTGYLQTLLGEEGMQVVTQIAHKERSDVDLAEKMELKANIIRKHLYAMYEAGVVTYRRHRSKTGWYTYYWKLHPERITKAINQEKDDNIQELMGMIEYEKTNHFYQCKNKCTRVVFDEATDLGFRCMKCDKPLEHSDNNHFIKELEKRVNNLQTVIEEPIEPTESVEPTKSEKESK
ncbi:MAG: hypothetical protein QF475_01450 [Candidatus Undinarchaeales archaeon]|jgi:transcription initiation factor TFIIE subunit alpha|nr:hypothetical protein [Candidatus Undinarchaeales archaeon]